jgi:flavin reductase (DIM6/NTAB) family NADH-FMN oxidoreductase RutF
METEKFEYRDVPAAEAYSLLNTGGVVLVCTKGRDGRYDLAPIAWSCPLDYEPTSRVLIVLDPNHRTTENLEAAGEFVLALPTYAQKALVEATGSVSGKTVDKYAEFGIAATPASAVDALVPAGAAGHLECRLIESRRVGSVAVVAAEVVRAAAVEEAWKYRLHHAGGEVFYRPGPVV